MTKQVLIVEDQAGDISWLFDIIVSRGYEIDLATNEKAARDRLLAVKNREASYALAVIDVMVAVTDLMDLVEIDDIDEKFYQESRDTGIRLCRWVRKELEISPEDLPIVCISAREEEEVKNSLQELEILLFSRAPHNRSGSIRQYIEKNLPEVPGRTRFDVD